MTVLIQPSALVDLKAGLRFYQKRGEDVADYFLESIYADIDSLKLFAGIHSRHLGMFRLLSDRFPYAIYYDISGTTVRVRAVLDLRRDPDWIARQLRRRR